MKNLDQLLKHLLAQKNSPANLDALQLANGLIKEFNITQDSDLAETLEINADVNDQKAVRIWAQKHIHLIDQDETDFERYRQLRRLFQSKLPEYH